MKKDWEFKKLGEVCEVLDSKRKPITKRDRVEGEFPYYGATGILSYVNNYIFDEKLILIGEDGAKWKSGENTSFIVEGKYWVNNHAHVIKPNRKIITDNWIVYFLNFSDLSKYVTGLTVPKLNQEKMRSIEIPVPPLSEQKRIVEILEKSFETIGKAKYNAETNLKNAKEIFDSYLQNVFENKGESWEEKTVDDISEVEYGYTEKAKDEGDYRFVRITDTDENGLLVEQNKMYVDSFNEANKYLLNYGDLLMARTGASAGNVLLFESNEKAVFASYLIRIRLKKEIFSKLYWYFSKSKIYWNQVRKLSAGSAQPQFNGGALKQIIFSFPKYLKEQQSLASKLDSLSAETNKLKAIYNQKLVELEELKKSLLQKAFNGELTN